MSESCPGRSSRRLEVSREKVECLRISSGKGVISISPSVEMEHSMFPSGLAFAVWSILADGKCLSHLFEKAECFQPLCSEWEA